jgi:hypothetical protein
MNCEKCGAPMEIGEWPFCPHGFPLAGLSVINDELEGGARFFENMGNEPVWVASKSQWRREVAARQLVNVDRHDSAYYAKRRQMLDEKRRDLKAGRADAVSL